MWVVVMMKDQTKEYKARTPSNQLEKSELLFAYLRSDREIRTKAG
jgi:hypothetical protein